MRNRVFTDEQLQIARNNGIPYGTLSNRVKVYKWSVEKAINTPPRSIKPVKEKKKHDWGKEIYALYRGDELIADGTVFEISEITGKSVRWLQECTTESNKKRAGEIRLVMEYLGHEDDEDDW